MGRIFVDFTVYMHATHKIVTLTNYFINNIHTSFLPLNILYLMLYINFMKKADRQFSSIIEIFLVSVVLKSV